MEEEGARRNNSVELGTEFRVREMKSFSRVTVVMVEQQCKRT